MSALLYFLRLKSTIKENIKLKPASHHYACGLRASAYCILCSSLAATGVVSINLSDILVTWRQGVAGVFVISAVKNWFSVLEDVIPCCWLHTATELLSWCNVQTWKIVKIQTQKYFRLDFLRFSLFAIIWLISCCTLDIYYPEHQREESMFSFRVPHLLSFIPTVNFLISNIKSFCIIILIFHM